jgi:deoxyribose-phosphate aldolase
MREPRPIVLRTEPVAPRFANPATVITLPAVPTIKRIAGGQFAFKMAGRIRTMCPDLMLTTVPCARFFTSLVVLSTATDACRP